MKQFLKITAFAFIIAMGSAFQNRASAQYADEDVSYQTFYDELSPYGQWIEYPDYGYVWSPDQGADFRPYSSNGHWVYSDDYDWIWVSDYDWGWAPFHYGRWFMDPAYGWLWVPGYEWAPAWVAWRSGGDYYGWAPLRPGISISIGFSLGNYYAPDDYWCFSPRRYITSPRIYDYCIDRRQNVNIIRNTIIINNYSHNRNVFVTGPRRTEVETYCGRINPVQFRSSTRPGRASFRNNEVAIYRPRVQRDDNRKFSPGHFDRYKQDRRNNEERIARNDNNQQRNNIFRRDNRNNSVGDVSNNNNNGRIRQQNNGSNEQREYRGLDPRRRAEVNNQANGNNNRERNQPSPINRERANGNNNRERNQPSPINRERANGNNNRERNQPSPINRERANDNNNRERNQPSPINRERANERKPDDNNRNFQNNRQQQQQVERQNRASQREQRPQVERQQQPRNFDRRDNGNSDQNKSGSRGRNGFRKKD